jgi:hypothetical protein
LLRIGPFVWRGVTENECWLALHTYAGSLPLTRPLLSRRRGKWKLNGMWVCVCAWRGLQLAASISSLQRTADANAAAAAQQLQAALRHAATLEDTVTQLRVAAEAAAREREEAATQASQLAAEVGASRAQAARQAEAVVAKEAQLQAAQADKRAAEDALAAAQVRQPFDACVWVERAGETAGTERGAVSLGLSRS